MQKINISYNRRSTEDGERQVQSIEDQKEVNQEQARRLNEEIGLVIEDEKSAKLPYQRDGFDQLVDMINNDKVNNIYCWKLDRLARNEIEAGIIKHNLTYRKINSIVTPYRVYRPEDNVIISSVDFSMATQYSLDLAINSKRGKDRKAKNGWFPGVAPLGYKNTPKRNQGERIIIKDPENWEKMRKIFKLMLTGDYTPAQLLKIANDELEIRFESRTGFGGLALPSLCDIFRNPFYTGIFRYNNKIYQGKHPAMITQEEYTKIQAIMTGNNNRKFTHKHKYSGIFKCGECGYSITAEPEKYKYVKSRGETSVYKYWRCTKKHPVIKCSQSAVREEELEEQLVQVFKFMNLDQRYVDWMHKWLDHILRDVHRDRLLHTKKLNREIDEVNGDLVSLRQLMASKANISREIITEEEFLRDKRVLLDRRDDLRDKLQNFDLSIDKQADELKSKMDFCNDLSKRFKKADPEEKKVLINRLARTAVIKNGLVHLEMESKLFKIVEMQKIVFNPEARLEPGKQLTGKENDVVEMLNGLVMPRDRSRSNYLWFVPRLEKILPVGAFNVNLGL